MTRRHLCRSQKASSRAQLEFWSGYAGVGYFQLMQQIHRTLGVRWSGPREAQGSDRRPWPQAFDFLLAVPHWPTLPRYYGALHWPAPPGYFSTCDVVFRCSTASSLALWKVPPITFPAFLPAIWPP